MLILPDRRSTASHAPEFETGAAALPPRERRAPASAPAASRPESTPPILSSAAEARPRLSGTLNVFAPSPGPNGVPQRAKARGKAVREIACPIGKINALLGATVSQ